jgi:hypothetical protein
VEVARFIAPHHETGGRPPDLFVFQPTTRRFRFVECKRPTERLTKAQLTKFVAIENYLNQHVDRDRSILADPEEPNLFPNLSEGQWIHLVRFAPVPKPTAA